MRKSDIAAGLSAGAIVAVLQWGGWLPFWLFWSIVGVLVGVFVLALFAMMEQRFEEMDDGQ